MLTLPMAGILKKHFPDCTILFLGRNYSRAIIETCSHVDSFLSWDDVKALSAKDRTDFFSNMKADVFIHVFPDKQIAALAQEAGIRIRIGTSHRLFHLLTCNKLVHFSRRNSKLHESQLNLKLLSGLGILDAPEINALDSFMGFDKIPPADPSFSEQLGKDKYNLILHPKSRGSAREWGLENFSKLIALLPEEKFRIFISGTTEEGKSMKDFIRVNPRVIDLTGKLSLSAFISFISSADALVAASTGPLHIAAALGKCAIGIYAPMRPIHPGRWAPIGPNASFFVNENSCSDCIKNSECHCIREIAPEKVAGSLIKDAEVGRLPG